MTKMDCASTKEPTVDPRSRLIVALDVADRAEAIEMANRLKGSAGTFKVGLQLFTAYGPSIIEPVLKTGAKVFLDLKLHDIPNTVGNAVVEACRLGVHMLTLHTSGGPAMLERARVVVEEQRALGLAAPLLLGVTVLTSLSQDEISRVGFAGSLESLVVRLARLAESAGIDGVVCSPQELRRLRQERIDGLFFVTPGVRPSSGEKDDQRRVMTPSEAIRAGARYLVVGRPILKDPDPAAAAEALLREIESAMLE